MPSNSNKRYVVLKSFLSHRDQQQLVKEALDCHFQNASAQPQEDDHVSRPEAARKDWKDLETSTSSLKLQLGIDCGGSLHSSLPLAVSTARRAFRTAIQLFASDESSIIIRIPPVFALDTTPLTGLALLYGPNSRMNAHYDSPTQPLQREEWLAMMTLGNPTVFRCNDELVTLQSGDVLVMDSMATLHGVEEILPGSENGNGVLTSDDLGLPVPGSRLGILLWQGRMKDSSNLQYKNMGETDTAVVDGIKDLFETADDESI